MGAPKRQFNRPSINLGGGPKKDWIETEVQNLAPGDTVRGWGSVSTLKNLTEHTIIEWSNGRNSVLLPTDKVIAFTTV